jgi:cytochrome c553
MIPVLAVFGRADSSTFSQQEFQAKLVYRKTCHGVAGRGYPGASSMPQLAGQQPEYLENQLFAFAEGRRKDKFMSKVAKISLARRW